MQKRDLVTRLKNTFFVSLQKSDLLTNHEQTFFLQYQRRPILIIEENLNVFIYIIYFGALICDVVSHDAYYMEILRVNVNKKKIAFLADAADATPRR